MRTPSIEKICQQLLEIGAQIAQLQDQEAQLRSHLATLGAGKHAAGAYTVQVTVPKRLDARKLEAAYPVATNPGFYQPKLSTAMVRKHISQADLAAGGFFTEGAPSVKVVAK